MAWVILIAAGLFEIAGVLGINKWNARRNAVSLVWLLGGFAGSLTLLSVAMKSISMGTAYAVWTAIGTAGGTLVGMVYYGESRQVRRIFFLTLVLGAVIGLKLIGEEA